MNRRTAVLLSLWLMVPSVTGVTTARADVTEDSPSWSCANDGNRICGPNNSNGEPAGCYDDGGVMVAAWPCHTVTNPDGSADVYYGAMES